MQSFDTVVGTPLLWPALRMATITMSTSLPPTDGHYRRTVNPLDPRTPTRLVLVIGGSLVFGPAVPDANTIPSLLSRYLNAEDPSHGYKVVNAGVDGAVSGQELARLQIRARPWAEAGSGRRHRRPGRFRPRRLCGQARRLALSGRGTFGELVHHYVALAYLRLAAVSPRRDGDGQGLAQGAGPSEGPGPGRRAHPGSTASIYVRNELAMARWPRRPGLDSCWRSIRRSTARTTRHPTADIAYATDLAKRLYPGQAEVTRQTRAALAEAVASLRSQGVDAVNLSDLLRDKTVDVFVETAHFNATGHEMIAAAIAREILHGTAP